MDPDLLSVRGLIKGGVFLFVLLLVEPSVSLLGLSLKSLAFGILIIILLVAFSVLGSAQDRGMTRFVMKSLALLSLIAFFMLVGLINGFGLDSVWKQTVAILNAYCVYALLKFATWREPASKRYIYIAVITGVVLFYVIKIYMIVLLAKGDLDINLLAGQMVKMLGPDTALPVTINEGVVRLQLPNEIIGIFALGVLWHSSIQVFKRRWIAIMAEVIICIGIISTMSRYLIVWGGFIALHKFIFNYMNRVKIQKLLFLLVVVILIVVLSWQDLSTTIFARFASSGTEVSYGDQLRREQYVALGSEFLRHPFFGTGIGGHSYEIIRNEFNPWMYEAQLLALTMQIGIIGIIWLASVLINFRRKIIGRVKELNIGWFLIFTGWLVASLTNPYLFSSLSGIMFWLCKQDLIKSSSNPG